MNIKSLLLRFINISVFVIVSNLLYSIDQFDSFQAPDSISNSSIPVELQFNILEQKALKYTNSDPIQSLAYCNQLKQLSDESNNDSLLHRYYLVFSDLQLQINNVNIAIELLQNNLNYYHNQPNYSQEIGYESLKLAKCFEAIANTSKAEHYYSISDSIFKKMTTEDLYSESIKNHSQLYINEKLFNQAYHLLKNASNFVQTKDALITISAQLGILFENLIQTNKNSTITFLSDNYTANNLALTEFAYDSSFHYHNFAYELSKSGLLNTNNPSVQVSLIGLSNYYKYKNNSELAKQFLVKAMNNTPDNDYFNLSLLSGKIKEIEKKNENYDSAYFWQQKHLEFSQKNSNIMEDAEIAKVRSKLYYSYQEEKELENFLQKKELQKIEHDINLKDLKNKQKWYNWIALILGFFLIGIATYIILTRKNIQTVEKQKEILNQQNIILKERNSAISESINYASYYQKNVLNGRELILNYLPKSKLSDEIENEISEVYYLFLPTNNNLIIGCIKINESGVPASFISVLIENWMKEFSNKDNSVKMIQEYIELKTENLIQNHIIQKPLDFGILTINLTNFESTNFQKGINITKTTDSFTFIHQNPLLTVYIDDINSLKSWDSI